MYFGKNKHLLSRTLIAAALVNLVSNFVLGRTDEYLYDLWKRYRYRLDLLPVPYNRHRRALGNGGLSQEEVSGGLEIRGIFVIIYVKLFSAGQEEADVS